ncbi:TRAP transporter large permease [Desulfopila inferna]|uniref:TRAP transporter large permease n=1 Tax=Desulfopila inferna TaxID=468528 RepID=UPI001963E8A3|nr:TRAP transporter large permease subunit [Desulfopila inferna]MBM9604489.1 TRAP transporter large permease subunit [Desulfopila inferna]
MDYQILIAFALVGLLFCLLISGLEIGWSVGITAVVGLVWYVDQPLGQLAETSFGALNSFTLTALPLFIFMGGILGNTGINERLFGAIEKWVGGLPGGLACSVICGNAVFGAMCGSTIAATATFGKVAFPVMEKKKYSPKLALGSIASGTVLAPLIPPSILLILYGAWQGLSIVDLLAAGLIPGLTLTFLFIIAIIIQVKLNPSLAPATAQYSWSAKFRALLEVFPFAGVIFGVLGAIFGGIMTPTEAAALGAFLSILLTLAYRKLTFAIVQKSLLDTVKITAFSLFIMAMSSLISHVFNSAGIIPMIKDFVIALPVGKYGILLLFFVMYLILGMFFDSWSMLFLTFPFVMPIIVGLDINPIWWGIVYVMAGEQSTITPPFGLTLFVLKGVVPHHSMGTIVRGSLPFLIPIYINILLLFMFPQLALWLPNFLKGG